MTLLVTGGGGFVMSNLARRWYDVDQVDLIVDVPNSAVASGVRMPRQAGQSRASMARAKRTSWAAISRSAISVSRRAGAALRSRR